MAFQLQLIEQGGRLGAHLEYLFLLVSLVLLVLAAKKIADAKAPKWRELSAIASVIAINVFFLITNELGAFPNAVVMKWIDVIVLLFVAIALYKITIKKK
ncbi:MAG: hypothetical protein QW331_00535 [Candidatus Woesearchaeota archaeon]